MQNAHASLHNLAVRRATAFATAAVIPPLAHTWLASWGCHFVGGVGMSSEKPHEYNDVSWLYFYILRENVRSPTAGQSGDHMVT